MTQELLQWHPAFCSAMQIELEGEDLQFFFEFNLTRKPLQIDALIIHKKPEVKIRKNIGRIFRVHNIVEYKSPDDHFTIEDFNKVLAYACIYQSNTDKTLEIHPQDITITCVINHYPRNLFKLLSEQYGRKHFYVRQMYAGIYYLSGLPFPTQILVTHQLSPDENLWLSRLRSDLDAEKDRDVLLRAYYGKDHIPRYSTFMDVVVRANISCFKGGTNMCNAILELVEDTLLERKQEGIKEGIKQGVIQGRCLMLIEQVCQKILLHKTVPEIAQDLGRNEAEIESIYHTALAFAPDYPIDEIYQQWIKNQ